MPVYFFHVDNGSLSPDQDGTELPDVEAARAEAVALAGALLRELDGEFWAHGRRWTMHVTDDQGRLLFSLHFGAEIPSGDIRYLPD